MRGKEAQSCTLAVEKGEGKGTESRQGPRGFSNSSPKMKYVKPLSLFHDLLKTKAVDRGRLLGLDVGDKYVGLAISDAHNKIASPLSVLVRKKTNIDLMADDFKTLISKLSLVGFVVGCPFDRHRRSPDNVELLLKPLDLHPVQAKTIVDKFAAVGILQGYLDYVNRKLEALVGVSNKCD